tara:strand:+ start:277 stop:399 length:123 start_codon:yes stop_codon:yes gene_type:complete
MKTLKKLEKWFDLNVAWIFVNGRKREWWDAYIRDKYFKDI